MRKRGGSGNCVFDSDIQMIYPEDTLFPADDLFPVEQEPFYTIDNGQMQTESLKITESLCESDTLTYGECNAAQFEVTVADVLQDLTGKNSWSVLKLETMRCPWESIRWNNLPVKQTGA